MSSVKAEDAKNVWLKNLTKEQRKILSTYREQFTISNNSGAVWEALREYLVLQKEYQDLKDKNQVLNRKLDSVNNNFTIFKSKISQLADLEEQRQNLKEELIERASQPKITTIEDLNEKAEI